MPISIIFDADYLLLNYSNIYFYISKLVECHKRNQRFVIPQFEMSPRTDVYSMNSEYEWKLKVQSASSAIITSNGPAYDISFAFLKTLIAYY